MRIRRPRRIDRATAEHLLNGVPEHLHGAGPLAVPLVAARAPAFPDELVAEQAVLAAYQAAAHLKPGARRRPVTAVLAKLLTLKAAAAVVLSLTGVGGVALAAGSGVLPNPLFPDPPPPSPTVSQTPAERETTTPDPVAPVGPSADPSASPSSLVALCHAYAAVADQGRALDSPAFAALVIAAGGADQVDAYCGALDATAEPSAGPPAPGARPTARPSVARPDTPASRAPASRAPAGPPTGRPGRAPTAPPGR